MTDALSMDPDYLEIRLLKSIEALYPMLALIQFLGQRALSSCQAGAGMVGPAGKTHQAALHPNVLPHLNPIERLWGLMHRNVTTRTAGQVPELRRCDASFRRKSRELAGRGRRYRNRLVRLGRALLPDSTADVSYHLRLNPPLIRLLLDRISAPPEVLIGDLRRTDAQA